ncbi:MAG: cadmium-translocating P-type ATPase [Firmicutes bacterium]|nr:cadmium-translocating P-type ATPase [Bacillota bacterium]
MPTSETKTAAPETCRLSGLDCAACAAKIESRLQQDLDPEATIDFTTSTLMIDAAKVSQAQQIMDTIEPGVIIHPNSAVEPSVPAGHGEPVQLWPPILAGILFSIGLIFQPQLETFGGGWSAYIIFFAAYFLVGRGVISTAIRNAARGQIFDENFLMTIATLGAFAIGNLPEAVGVMLFYYVGELLQDVAVSRSRNSIQALLAIRPDSANLKTTGGIESVHPAQIKVGSVIIVRPGERIPLDGEILTGESFVDTSALTGEPVPKRVSPGNAVLAGMVNNSGLLQVKVTKAYGETSLARILDLVENAAHRKAPTEKLITKFARYYTPVVVFGASLVAILPPLFVPGAGLREWVHRALVLLVISCPCALVISVPLGYFGGIGGASRQGILIKGANYLEALVDIDTVVFDKTGTLTEGVFQVQQVIPANGFAAETVLDLAAQAEVHSSHPIALSILEASSLAKPNHAGEGVYEEVAGKGVKARINETEILVGNTSLLTDQGISFSSPSNNGFTTVYVAANGEFAGTIVIADRIKPDTASAIHDLRHLGVKRTVMLTGDAIDTAHQVSHQVGIDQVHAALLPHEKVAEVEALLATQDQSKAKLAFVGDGINDAPVLTRADVGIAMGGLGSDAAIEAADVVIMEDKPGKVAEAIRIARYTRRIIIQNIVLAFAVKALFIALGIAGVATLWEAVFADVGVALLAVFNSTRALRFKPGSKPICHCLPTQYSQPCGYR